MILVSTAVIVYHNALSAYFFDCLRSDGDMLVDVVHRITIDTELPPIPRAVLNEQRSGRVEIDTTFTIGWKVE